MQNTLKISNLAGLRTLKVLSMYLFNLLIGGFFKIIIADFAYFIVLVKKNYTDQTVGAFISLFTSDVHYALNQKRLFFKTLRYFNIIYLYTGLWREEKRSGR